jgi:hypothetical protein
VLITYPITHHWLMGSIFIVEKDADISNFEFYSHECTCVTSVCWEICGLSGVCLMKGAKIKWHLINLCRKFGHGSAINSWHLVATENVKVYEIECCSSMEYSCNHCGVWSLIAQVLFQTINIVLLVFHPKGTWSIHVNV